MTRQEVRRILSMNPEDMDLTGVDYFVVCTIDGDIRTALCTSKHMEPDVEHIWRAWYNIRLQMLRDNLQECPPDFRWQPAALTC